MNIRLMRAASCGVLCIAMLLSATDVGADRQFQRAERWELAWSLPKTTYLNYAVVQQKRLDAPEETEATQLEPALNYAHFMAAEFNANGEIDRRANPLAIEEMLLQPAMHVPAGRIREGATWKREWNFESVAGHPAIQLDSEYTSTGVEMHRGAECVEISSVHALKPSGNRNKAGSHWISFDARTTAWFHIERRMLWGAKLELHAALWRGADDGKREEMHWSLEFALSREIDSAGSKLREDVAEAIRRGSDRVLSWQRANNGWRHGRRHNRGGTALALLTLLMCDTPKDDPRIERGFAALQPMDLEDTYSVACSIMAYEARYISEEERRAWLANPDGQQDFKRELSAADRKEVERLVQWLKDNQNEPNPFYNYKRGHEDDLSRFDFSCTQYALLGFAAALRCDVKIPTGIVKPLVERIIDYQQEAGPRIRRVTDYQPAEGKREARSTVATKAVEARGWNYRTRASWDRYAETGDAYGSMTTAGLTCLLVGLEIARSMNEEDFRAEFGNRSVFTNWERRATESLESGMAWMEHWFSATRNPNRGRGWYEYYLYGLERIMVLSRTRYLGTRNWYNEGAAALVAIQDEHGGWGNLAETCLALLFLKKGTVPPKRRVITGDK